jgi:hypothetical protein
MKKYKSSSTTKYPRLASIKPARIRTAKPLQQTNSKCFTTADTQPSLEISKHHFSSAPVHERLVIEEEDKKKWTCVSRIPRPIEPRETFIKTVRSNRIIYNHFSRIPRPKERKRCFFIFHNHQGLHCRKDNNHQVNMKEVPLIEESIINTAVLNKHVAPSKRSIDTAPTLCSSGANFSNQLGLGPHRNFHI